MEAKRREWTCTKTRGLAVGEVVEEAEEAEEAEVDVAVAEAERRIETL